MEKLVSSWYNNVQPLPETYIFPPEARPGKLSTLPSSDNIPVIDLGGGGAQGHDRTRIVEQVLGASEEFGFFQVTEASFNFHDLLYIQYLYAYIIFQL